LFSGDVSQTTIMAEGGREAPALQHEIGDGGQIYGEPRQLVVDAGGDVRCIYVEVLHLREIRTLQITPASHVKPDADGYWRADMGPVYGPTLGPFASRSEALGAEREVTGADNDAEGVVMTKDSPSSPSSIALLALVSSQSPRFSISPKLTIKPAFCPCLIGSQLVWYRAGKPSKSPSLLHGQGSVPLEQQCFESGYQLGFLLRALR
jgi:hypothetical protein